jgi:hypothetical protein
MAGTDFDVGAALAQIDARIAALEAHTAEAADAQSGTDAEATGNAAREDAVAAAASKVNRAGIWTAVPATAATTAPASPSDAAAVEAFRRPLKARLDAIIAKVAASACAQSLRDVNRTLVPARGAIDCLAAIAADEGGAASRPKLSDDMVEAYAQLLPTMHAAQELGGRVAHLAARLDDPRLSLWASCVAAPSPGATTIPLAEVAAHVEAATASPMDQPVPTVAVDPAELQAAMANAERAMQLLERFEKLQQDQIRFAAYVSDAVRRKHLALSARESRLAGFAANAASADS